ncbi:MAG: hypothetical protein Q7R85_02840 [bacterium]|nr:hypothetical protein [bacterium]
MDALRRLVFSLVAFVVVGAAGYYILKQDRVFEVVIPSGVFGDKARAVINPTREKIINTVDSVVGAVKEKAQGVIDGVTGVIKQKAFESVKDAVNDKLNEVGKDLGVPKTTTAPLAGAIVLGGAPAISSSNNVPLGFSVKRGQLAVFVLKDVAEGSAKVPYAIQWGDGSTESGTLADKDAKTISHTWGSVGEYTIKITMTVGETIMVYEVYIMVYA